MSKFIRTLMVAVLLCVGCVSQSAKKGTSGLAGTAALQSPSVAISSMSVTPANQSVQVGVQVGYTASVTLSNGNSYSITPFVTWTSSNNAIASPTSLTNVELYSCNSAGTIQVTATFGAVISASTSLSCTAPPPPPTLTSITISPVNPSCSVGQTQGFNAIGVFSDGSTQDITATAVWTSTDNTIANPTGLSGGKEVYACLKGGSVTVTATQSSISGTTTLTSNAVLSSITVAPSTASILVGNQQQFSATCNYNDGSTQNCSPTWSSSATGVATINSAGLATGVAAGSATITATIGSISGTASLTVSNQGPPPPTLTSITVTPANSTINTGTTLQYTATCNYSDGSTQNCTSLVTWNSTTPATATISSSGLATAVAVGTTTIQATYQSITGSTGLTVQAPVPTLVSIAVTPASPSVYVNSSIGFIATGTYSDGSKKDVTLSSTWTTSAPSVATLSALADPQVANCASAGQSTIGATIGAISGTTLLTCVNNPPPNLGNDAYCPAPSHVCNFGGTDHTATLPRTGYYTDPSTYPGGGTLRTIQTTADWTAAWAAAVCGDILQQNAGSTLTNPSIPPAKSCANNPIIYRTSGYASLPAYGTKITPCFAGISSLPGRPPYNCPPNPQNFMAKITTGTSKSALIYSANTAGVVWIGIEFTRNSGTGFVDSIISQTQGGVNHIIYEQDWCHGDETGDETNTCYGVTATNYIALLDSFTNDFYCVSAVGTCTDAHVIGGGLNNVSGCADGVYKIVDNFLEGAAQSFLEGGGAAQCTPTDIEYRNNWEFKPNIWNPACTAASPCSIYENIGAGTVVYNGGFQGGHAVLVKNHFELKNAAYVIYEGNRADNVWAGFSQAGESIILTPKNQAGPNGTNLCPLCQVHDVTIRYSDGGFAQQVFQIANAPSDNGGFTQGGNSYSIHDVFYDNLMPVNLYGAQGSTALMGKAVEDTGTPTNNILHDVYMDHITFIPAATNGVVDYQFIGIDGAMASTGREMFNFTFTNFVAPLLHGAHTQAGGANDCSLNQTNAIGMLTHCYSPLTFGGHVFVDTLGQGNNVSWPGNNCLTQTTFASTVVNYNNGIGGNYQLTACKGTGTDGKDPGADIQTVETRTQIATTFGAPPAQGPSAQPNFQLAFPSMPAGCLDPNYISLNATNNEFYLACRDGGFYKSTNQGAAWTNINSNVTFCGGCGAFTLQYNPNDGSLVANVGGTGSGSTVTFWRSTNDGGNWTKLTAGTPPNVYHNTTTGAVSGCAILTNGGLECGGWFGSNNQSGFFSTNNGATNALSTYTPAVSSVFGLGANPHDGSIWTGTENGGIFRSADGGNTAINVFPPQSNPQNGDTSHIVFDSSGNPLLSDQGGVWRGVGSGTGPYTWTNTFSGISAQGRGMFVDSLGSVYWSHGHNANSPNSLFRSLDSGQTWKPWDTGLPQQLEVFTMLENPNDGKIYIVIENGQTNAGWVYSTPK